MQTRKILRSGLVLLALSMPAYFTGCSNQPVPVEPTSTSQTQSQQERIKLEEKLKKAEEELEKSKGEYDTLKIDLDRTVRERDIYYNETTTYPKNTPEDIVKDNQRLRNEVFKLNTTADVGRDVIIASLSESNRKLRNENYRLKNENDTAREHLVHLRPPICIDSLSGKKIPTGLTPYDEECDKNRELKLRLEKEEQNRRNTELGHDLEKDRLGRELGQAMRERDAYKEAYFQWRDYAKSLGGTAKNPRQNSWQDFRSDPRQSSR